MARVEQCEIEIFREPVGFKEALLRQVPPLKTQVLLVSRCCPIPASNQPNA